MNILIVDDSKSMHIRVEMLLRDSLKQPHTIFHSYDGKQGLELVKNSTESFDLIFTDIEMPDMNGIEFLKRAKLYTLADLVVMSSKENECIEAQRAKAFGATFVNKNELSLKFKDPKFISTIFAKTKKTNNFF